MSQLGLPRDLHSGRPLAFWLLPSTDHTENLFCPCWKMQLPSNGLQRCIHYCCLYSLLPECSRSRCLATIPFLCCYRNGPYVKISNFLKHVTTINTIYFLMIWLIHRTSPECVAIFRTKNYVRSNLWHDTGYPDLGFRVLPQTLQGNAEIIQYFNCSHDRFPPRGISPNVILRTVLSYPLDTNQPIIRRYCHVYERDSRRGFDWRLDLLATLTCKS
jgi:hypothetical protein